MMRHTRAVGVAQGWSNPDPNPNPNTNPDPDPNPYPDPNPNPPPNTYACHLIVVNPAVGGCP